jgi:hypothetical protein
VSARPLSSVLLVGTGYSLSVPPSDELESLVVVTVLKVVGSDLVPEAGTELASASWESLSRYLLVEFESVIDHVAESQLDISLRVWHGVDVEDSVIDDDELQGGSNEVVYVVVKVPVSVTMLSVFEFVQLVEVVVAASADAVWLDLSSSLLMTVPEVATTLLEAVAPEAVVLTEGDADASVEAVDRTAAELEPLPVTMPLEMSEAEAVVEASDGCVTVVVEVYVGEPWSPD